MMEMKIKIEVPDLAAAVEKLAAAMTVDPNILTPDTPRPQMPTPVTDPAPVMPQTPGPAPTAPAAPAPVPQTPVANPTQEAVSAPTAPTAAPAAPLAGQTSACLSNPAPAPAPAPAVPVAGAPTYTLDQISKAGAALVDAGKMEPLLGLLTKYGVQAITQLQPAQYGVFATELRALGAQI